MRMRRPIRREEDEAQGKDWTVVDRNYKHTRLYRVDVATGKSELMTHRGHDGAPTRLVAPDGQQLVIGARR